MNTKSVLIILAIVCFSLFGSRASINAQENHSSDTPDGVIKELYKVHNKGKGPMLQREGKRYLAKFFDKKLYDLFWKNIAETPEGEIGNLDFDPFYNGQDFQITRFQIGAPKIEKDKAVVVVSFNNFGQKTKITFKLRSTNEGWKIENLVYEDGTDLIEILSAPL